MNSLASFILIISILIILIFIEDYLLWRLLILKVGMKPNLLKSSFPPGNYPMRNRKSYETTNNQPGNQAINKKVLSQKLDCGPEQPEYKGEYCNADNYQYNLDYCCFGGISHLSHLIKIYKCSQSTIGETKLTNDSHKVNKSR